MNTHKPARPVKINRGVTAARLQLLIKIVIVVIIFAIVGYLAFEWATTTQNQSERVKVVEATLAALPIIFILGVMLVLVAGQAEIKKSAKKALVANSKRRKRSDIIPIFTKVLDVISYASVALIIAIFAFFVIISIQAGGSMAGFAVFIMAIPAAGIMIFLGFVALVCTSVSRKLAGKLRDNQRKKASAGMVGRASNIGTLNRIVYIIAGLIVALAIGFIGQLYLL